MRRLPHPLLALSASAVILLGSQVSPDSALAQPRTPCDQIQVRLADVQAQAAQVRADIWSAADAGDSAALAGAMDQLDNVFTATDALLQRMDECSRSPVPSFAD
jgi:hypothetical protein